MDLGDTNNVFCGNRVIIQFPLHCSLIVRLAFTLNLDKISLPCNDFGMLQMRHRSKYRG